MMNMCDERDRELFLEAIKNKNIGRGVNYLKDILKDILNDYFEVAATCMYGEGTDVENGFEIHLPITMLKLGMDSAGNISIMNQDVLKNVGINEIFVDVTVLPEKHELDNAYKMFPMKTKMSKESEIDEYYSSLADEIVDVIELEDLDVFFSFFKKVTYRWKILTEEYEYFEATNI